MTSRNGPAERNRVDKPPDPPDEAVGGLRRVGTDGQPEDVGEDEEGQDKVGGGEEGPGHARLQADDGNMEARKRAGDARHAAEGEGGRTGEICRSGCPVQHRHRGLRDGVSLSAAFLEFGGGCRGNKG